MTRSDFFKKQLLDFHCPNIIDIGCSFPQNLYMLYHYHDSSGGVGIETKRERFLLDIRAKKLIIDEYNGLVDECQINNFVHDCSSDCNNWIHCKECGLEKSIYNSYKLYTIMKLRKTPLSFEEFQSTFLLDHTGVLDYLAMPHNEDIDIIIVSKFLSKLSKKDAERTLYELILRLSKDGKIFLRLITNDFSIDGENKHVYHLKEVLNIMKMLKTPVYQENNIDGYLHYEIVGSKPDDLSDLAELCKISAK